MEVTHTRYKKIKRTVIGCKKLFDTTDPFQICKLLGIEICFLDLSSDVFGFTDFSSAPSISTGLRIINATIFLSSRLGYYGEKIVCAHELGHILLQYNVQLNLFDPNREEDSLTEYEANIFVLELMPHIYNNTSIDYRLLNKHELQDFMNKKITNGIQNLDFTFKD